MNELLDTLDNLTKELDSSPLVSELKEIQEKIKKNKPLMKLLEEYSSYPKESLKKEIIENPLFQEFKIKETELNLFIMDMNQRLGKISKSRKCGHESH